MWVSSASIGGHRRLFVFFSRSHGRGFVDTPVDVTGSAGERSPGAPFGASLTDRGLRLAVLAVVLPASPRIPEEARAQRAEMPATGRRGAADSERASCDGRRIHRAGISHRVNNSLHLR